MNNYLSTIVILLSFTNLCFATGINKPVFPDSLDGASPTDIDLQVSATSTPLQFGDLAEIVIRVENKGPATAEIFDVLSRGFIQGLRFPIDTTCNIDLFVSRDARGSPSGFVMAWLIEDLQVGEVRECVVTLPVKSNIRETETIQFVVFPGTNDPDLTNNESFITLQYLGLGGYPVPGLSAIGILLLISLIAGLSLVKIRPGL